MAKLIDTIVNGTFQLTGTGQMSGDFPFSGGNIIVNDTTPLATVHITASGANNVPLRLEGYTGQIANLIELSDSVDNANFAVDVNGSITGAGGGFFGTSANGQIIDSSGYLSATSGTAMWDDLQVSLAAVPIQFGPPTANNPDFVQIFDDGAGSNGVYAWHFDPTTLEEIFFSVQMPHGYMLESDIKPHVHWIPTSGLAGSVVWGLEYTIGEVSGTFGNTTIITGASSGDATQNKQIIGILPDIPGSAMSATSNVIICRLFRDSTDPADDYGDDVAAISFDFHYQKDTQGSRQEYIK